MKFRAIDKLNREYKESNVSDIAKVIFEKTVNTVKSFCENEKFAEAVVKQEKTIAECCENIVKEIAEAMKNPKTRIIGTGLSDVEVYKKAAEFYFPGADICFSMKIVLPEEEPKNNKVIKLSLDKFI